MYTVQSIQVSRGEAVVFALPPQGSPQIYRLLIHSPCRLREVSRGEAVFFALPPQFTPIDMICLNLTKSKKITSTKA